MSAKEKVAKNPVSVIPPRDEDVAAIDRVRELNQRVRTALARVMVGLSICTLCFALALPSTARGTGPKSLTLADALDQPGWLFETGGSAEWFPQTEESQDGEHAARSGGITHNQESWVDTTVEGAGTLSFWWKVSSEDSFDFLEFYINGVRQDRIAGEVNWTQQTYTLGEDENVLRWRYTKDGSVHQGEDAGWVDQIVFHPDDPLDISPVTPWKITAYSSLPISGTRVYTLTNEGDDPLDLSASTAAAWLNFSAPSATLDPGQSIDLTASIASNAAELPVGVHKAELIFLNITTGVDQVRDAVLTLLPEPGEIEVTDSISPSDDHALPFGEVSIGVITKETIRVRNIHAKNNLHVERIQLRPVEAGGASSTLSLPSNDPPEGQEAYCSFSSNGNSPPANGRGGKNGQPPLTPDWDREHDPQTLLVRFKKGAAALDRISTHDTLGGRVARTMRRIPLDVIEIPKGASLKAVQNAYQNHPAVEYAEPNYRVSIFGEPNDPRFGELWGLHNTGQNNGVPGADISALEAWTWTRGSEEVIVAVIDTGIDYNHPDIAANMWVNPNPTFGDIHGATWTGGNGAITNGDPMDDNGHGTHVSGTIGAVGDNNVGVVGVNWNVRLMGLKFLTASGFGSTADAIAALEYAIDNGAHVTNNSWGGSGFSQAMKEMIAAAGEANQLFVAAAGNGGLDNDISPSYPASYDLDNILSVAGSTRSDERSLFSNWGANTVHLAAPGSDILSTVHGGGYDTYSGTSMASPHVAGVVALIYSFDPSAGYTRVKEAILKGVTPLPQWEGLVLSGGRLNAAAALREVVKEFRTVGIPDLPLSLAPGRSLVFEVEYKPLDAGSHEAYILIESQDVETPAIEVLLSGNGVADVLEIVEEEIFFSKGFAGGPFEPETKTYTLRNNGSPSVSWKASVSNPWLVVNPASGSLDGGAETLVELRLGSASHDLAAALHQGSVTFTNFASGLTQHRDVRLNVLPWPGSLAVTDSAPPEDDHRIPFGRTEAGGERMESVTLHNTHEEYSLIVENLLLLGSFREDFDQLPLLGWEARPAGAWQLASGGYEAALEQTTRFMQSTYVEELWYNATLEVSVCRTGDMSATAVLLLRASPDFDIHLGVGTAMMVGLSGDGMYFIARFIDGKLQWIQPWTSSPHLNTGTDANVIVASLKNQVLHVFANDQLLWSGQAGGIFRPGRMGLAGFTSRDDSTQYRFEYLDVREPLEEEHLSLSVLQSWHNAHPASPDESYASAPAPAPIEPVPAEKLGQEEPSNYAEIRGRQETFQLPELPSFPFQIAPGEDRTLDVLFTPSGEGAFSRTLRIISNDPDQPVLDVAVSGSSEMDFLRLFPRGSYLAEGEVGGPFTPVSTTYGLLNSGDGAIPWEIASIPAWLTTDTSAGLLEPGTVVNISVSVSEEAETLARGIHTGAINIVNTQTGFVRSIPVKIDVRPLLGEALMARDLPWTTGGDATWFGQDRVTRRRDLATQSGSIGDSEESWVETVVTGPGEISFWWMVSSENNYDFLEFHVNGQRRVAISGEVFWEERTQKFLEGTHTLRWRYMKDFMISRGDDAGWLDEVVWTPTPPKRIIALAGEVSFGVISVGESTSRTLVVGNNGDSTLAITSIEFPDGFSGNWESATIAPGASRDLIATFTPGSEGNHGGVLRFMSNATSGVDEVQFSGSATPAGDAMELTNEQVISGLDGAIEGQTRFFMKVPDHRASLEVRIFGGTGDADLYVRRGAPPQLDQWDYAPLQVGNNETIFIYQPLGGDWYFLVHAYKNYSGVSITAKFEPLTLGSWAKSIGLPEGQRGPLDRHGPLDVTTLLAYGFGHDPRLLSAAELPRIERSLANPAHVQLIYQVQTEAEDVSVVIETSSDLIDWETASPVSLTVLSESAGVEIRKAIFETGSRKGLFFRVKVRQLSE